MIPKNTSFAQGWWGIDLAPYRSGGLLSTSDIPTVDEQMFRGDFHWLPRLARSEYLEVDLHEEVAHLSRQTQQQNLSLPTPFVRFMSDRVARNAIYSCTACFWDLSTTPAPIPDFPHHRAVRFLSDQQGCLFWYLLLGPELHGQILCSPLYFDDLERSVTWDELDDLTCLCAPGFEHFVYRFWIENEIWSAMYEKRALLPEQEAYLAFYQKPRET